MMAEGKIAYEYDDPCDDCTDWIVEIARQDDLKIEQGPAVRSTDPTDLDSDAERLIRLSLRSLNG